MSDFDKWWEEECKNSIGTQYWTIEEFAEKGWIAALKCMLEHRYEVVDERLKFPMDVIDAKHLEKEIEEVENND